MATKDVLSFFREVEPAFSQESDEDLIEFIGATQKEFLQEDPEFSEDYKNVLRGQMDSARGATVVAGVAEFGETALKSGIKGALDVFASVPKSIALGASEIDKLRGKDTSPEDFVTYKFGEYIREAAEEKFPIDEQARETWASKIGQGLGSAAAFLAGGALGKAAGVPGTSIALLGSAATSNEFYEDAKRSGASEETASKAAMWGAGVGLSELVPLYKILDKIPGSKAVGFKKTLIDAAVSGSEEIAQENLQSAAQNITAQKLGYDPDRGTFEGFEEATVVGGVTGSLLSLLASAFGGRYRGRVQPKAEETTTPQTDAAVQEAGPVPVAREQADVITGARTEEEILATAPELPTVEQQELGIQPTPVATEAAEVIEGDRPLEEVLATAPELPTAPAVEEQAPQQFELFPEMDEVQRAASERANATIQEAQQLNLELEGLSNEVNQLQTQVETEPTTEATVALESKRQELETKRQQVQSKKQESIEASLDARETEAEQDESIPLVDGNLDVETDVAPEGKSLITLGAIDPLFQAEFELNDQGKVEFTGTRMARLGRRVRTFLRGGPGVDVATEAEIKARSALQTLEGQASRLANSLESRLSEVYKGIAPDQRNLAPINRILKNASLLGTTRPETLAQELFAYKGRDYKVTEQDVAQAAGILETIQQARGVVDYLARKQVDLGMVEGSVADVFSQNLGFYLTRSYKVFSKAYGWNWDTVPSDIKKAAVSYIKSNQKVSEEEAVEAAQTIVENAEQTFDWMMGTSPTKGVPARLLRGRQDIPKPIRDLLGEIKDPVANIYTTIAKQADLVIGFQLQNRVAESLVQMGLASDGKDRSKGFTQRLFENDPITKLGSAKKYPSLRPLYTTPEIARQLNEYYRVAKLPRLLQKLAKSVRVLTGVGKYSQVILSPKAYSTQFIAAIVNEMANGRVGLSMGLFGKGITGKAADVPLHKLNAKAVSILRSNKKKRESGKELTSLEERDAFLGMKGSDFLDNFKSILSERPVLLEDLAIEFGALGDQIDLRLLEDTILSQREVQYLSGLDAKRALEELKLRVSPEQLRRFSKALVKKGFKALPTFYGGFDQAGKFNSFLVEAVNEAWANPDSRLEDILKQAGRVTESTTPNPARIPNRLREASNFGLLNTYVSWFLELIRNRYNQADIATTYLKSDNPRVRKLGARKLSALLITSAAIAGGAKELIEQAFQFTGDNDDEFDSEKSRIIRRWLLPPWDQDQATAIVRFDDKGFAYNNTSYVLQDTALISPVIALTKGKPWNEALEDSAKSAVSQFAGNAPFAQSVAEAVLNYDADAGRKIVGEYKPLSTRVYDKLTHVYKNAFQSGIDRLIREKAPKILDGSEGGHGRQYSVEEEIWSMVGVRNYGYNWEGAIRGKMQDYNFKYQEVNRSVSDRAIQALKTKGDAASLEEARRLEAEEEQFLKKIEDEYALFFSDMLKLGKVTEKQLDSYQRDLFPNQTNKKGGTRMPEPLVKASKRFR